MVVHRCDVSLFPGRLWIHSSVQPPNEDEINNQLTKAGLFDQRNEMDWPTGCLLGFCTVTDVLSQEDYREQYPDGPRKVI